MNEEKITTKPRSNEDGDIKQEVEHEGGWRKKQIWVKSSCSDG